MKSALRDPLRVSVNLQGCKDKLSIFVLPIDEHYNKYFSEYYDDYYPEKKLFISFLDYLPNCVEILKIIHFYFGETSVYKNELCMKISEKGFLNCLQYAHEHEVPWNKWTCAYAAGNGHLNCLRYAYEHGCQWNCKTCAYAARNSFLDCLIYAHEHGCPWNYKTCEYAANNG